MLVEFTVIVPASPAHCVVADGEVKFDKLGRDTIVKYA